MNEKIINRIRKMLALGQDSAASQGERENALRMAHNLLIKYNLDMAQVENHGAGEKREEFRGEFYGRPWALTVSMAVAKLFFCRYYFERSSRRDQVVHCFLGKESNSVTALEMSKYLIASVWKEANKQMRDSGLGAAFRRSFATGAASQINRRVNELIKESTKPQEPTGTALVLASLYQTEESENALAMEKLGVVVKRTNLSSKKSFDPQGFGQGVEFGQSLNLNRQLG